MTDDADDGRDAPEVDVQRLKRERDAYAQAVGELQARFDEKVEELSLVRQVGDALGSSLDLGTVCRQTVDLIHEAVSPENCSVMLVANGGLVLGAARGAYDDAATVFEIAAEHPRFAPGEGIAGAVAATRKPIRLDEAPADARYVDRPDSPVSPMSLLCLPLTVRDRVVGVINLSDSLPGAFEPRHERLLAIIANSVGMAAENARLFSEISRSREALAHENRNLRQALAERVAGAGLVGTSRAFIAAVQLAERVADTSANVLITGESGTGKEVIARSIHQRSLRKDKPFVAINCAALPDSLLEAELFGIDRGVATGVDARAGTFERADGGTLFLDEIGDMAATTQARVLRVLQERQVSRVGGRKPIDVDVRIVAATHRDLPAEIKGGRFREDLYYRLKVVTIHLPPLRERREDLVPLAMHFIARFASRHGRPERPLSRSAARALLGHRWPGNVRELEHAIEQAVLIADGGEIEPDDLGLSVVDERGVRLEMPDTVDDLPTTVGEVTDIAERRLIERALEAADGNRTHAARALGISRRTLLYKLKKLGLAG
ncbi:sigma 54-interacting transcriptional regulator [Myxococcota bacterium]|nr:sigma 54-interacting transcriptional regulator [Myxococcota bacterium]